MHEECVRESWLLDYLRETDSIKILSQWLQRLNMANATWLTEDHRPMKGMEVNQKWWKKWQLLYMIYCQWKYLLVLLWETGKNQLDGKVAKRILALCHFIEGRQSQYSIFKRIAFRENENTLNTQRQTHRQGHIIGIKEWIFLVKHWCSCWFDKKRKYTVRLSDCCSVCLLATGDRDVCKYLKARILSVRDRGLFQGTAQRRIVCMKWHSRISRVGQKDLLSMWLNYCSREGGRVHLGVGEGVMCVKSVIKDTERLQFKTHIL